MLNDKLLGCRVGRPRGLSQDRTERFVEQRRVCLAKAWGPIVGKGLALVRTQQEDSGVGKHG